ncbi:MAG: hypothetical protein RL033_1112, partial [Pseudomonadota bacterium]
MKLWTVFVCTMSVACTYGGSDDDPLMGLSPGVSTNQPVMGDDGLGRNDASTSSPTAAPTTPT